MPGGLHRACCCGPGVACLVCEDAPAIPHTPMPSRSLVVSGVDACPTNCVRTFWFNGQTYVGPSDINGMWTLTQRQYTATVHSVFASGSFTIRLDNLLPPGQYTHNPGESDYWYQNLVTILWHGTEIAQWQLQKHVSHTRPQLYRWSMSSALWGDAGPPEAGDTITFVLSCVWMAEVGQATVKTWGPFDQYCEGTPDWDYTVELYWRLVVYDEVYAALALEYMCPEADTAYPQNEFPFAMFYYGPSSYLQGLFGASRWNEAGLKPGYEMTFVNSNDGPCGQVGTAGFFRGGIATVGSVV